MGSQPTTTVKNTLIKAAKSYLQPLPRPSKLVESKQNPSPELSIMASGSVSKSVSNPTVKPQHHTFPSPHVVYRIPVPIYIYIFPDGGGEQSMKSGFKKKIL